MGRWSVSSERVGGALVGEWVPDVFHVEDEVCDGTFSYDAVDFGRGDYLIGDPAFQNLRCVGRAAGTVVEHEAGG